MMSYQPWMSSLMNSGTPSPFSSPFSMGDSYPNKLPMMMFSSSNTKFNFCNSSDSSPSTNSTVSTPKTSPLVPDPKIPFFDFDMMSMDDQEKKKLERKRARNRQAASKCRQKKMDRIKELEDQVLHEKHRGQRLDAELVELNRALANFRQMVERHSNTGCPNNSIRA
ncbi:hypothetical protein B9Z55_005487 [Caenorhabditis nigoni]|uniref:BZIP domain-containing protein n=1 Tax=Caenorhabditis nigoni TaxID=1611254 RepID=A0A2G5V1U5_9PELO|nr:hypothetical protein B9Z55_005487 [Caenorhabditis nigoni]